MIHDGHYDPKTHFFRSNRRFETRAPSSFRKSFATHNPVRLCPEELKSTLNYCDMPSQIRSKKPRLSRFSGRDTHRMRKHRFCPESERGHRLHAPLASDRLSYLWLGLSYLILDQPVSIPPHGSPPQAHPVSPRASGQGRAQIKRCPYYKY